MSLCAAPLAEALLELEATRLAFGLAALVFLLGTVFTFAFVFVFEVFAIAFTLTVD